MYLFKDIDYIESNSYKEESCPRLHAKHSHAGVVVNGIVACEVFAHKRAVDSQRKLCTLSLPEVKLQSNLIQRLFFMLEIASITFAMMNRQAKKSLSK